MQFPLPVFLSAALLGQTPLPSPGPYSRAGLHIIIIPIGGLVAEYKWGLVFKFASIKSEQAAWP